MTQDIKQRVEEAIKGYGCDDDHERYESCWTCHKTAVSLIIDLKFELDETQQALTQLKAKEAR